MVLSSKDVSVTAVQLGLVIQLCTRDLEILGYLGPSTVPLGEKTMDLVARRRPTQQQHPIEYDVISVSQNGDAFLELMR